MHTRVCMRAGGRGLSVMSDLCNPMDCSPPVSPDPGIFQARTLKQIAISYFRGSSQPRDRTLVSCVSCIGKQIHIRFELYTLDSFL